MLRFGGSAVIPMSWFLICILRVQLSTIAQTPGILQEKPTGVRVIETSQGFMVPYDEEIPGTGIWFKMMPVEGGELVFASSKAEAVNGDLAPSQLVRVKINPFWIARCEVTWREYAEYWDMNPMFRHVTPQAMKVDEDKPQVFVTAPTQIYDISYRLEFADVAAKPAVGMSQYAARQYSKWLSHLVGRNYRLPTEAEWIYASVAGSTLTRENPSAISQARQDVVCLGEVGEFGGLIDQTSYSGPAAVGSRTSNSWGICDMQGNVGEWVIDSGKSILDRLAPGRLSVAQTIGRTPASRFGHMVCGGSWIDPFDECQFNSRVFCSELWWSMDPDIPLSPWWMACGDDRDRAVGFRLIRPLNSNTKQMQVFWEPDSRDLAFDVRSRIDGGRGVQGPIKRELLTPPRREYLRGQRPWEK